MAQDWKGSGGSAFRIIGASNHCGHDRGDHDYYATDPQATDLLVRLEKFDCPILEPSCGEGHISKQLEKAGYEVESRDIVNRGYGDVADFLSPDNVSWKGDIITNPPYSFAQSFVEKAMQIIPDGRKVAMFLKLSFLEGKRRAKLFEKYPPRRVWVSHSRLKCAINGDFEHTGNSLSAYGWFVWVKGFTGAPEIHWFN